MTTGVIKKYGTIKSASEFLDYLAFFSDRAMFSLFPGRNPLSSWIPSPQGDDIPAWGYASGAIHVIAEGSTKVHENGVCPSRCRS